jgi:hypothetical protein
MERTPGRAANIVEDLTEADLTKVGLVEQTSVTDPELFSLIGTESESGTNPRLLKFTYF